MTNEELMELLATYDPAKPVLFVRDPDDETTLTIDDVPYEITGVESFQDVLLLTRRPQAVT